MTDQKQYRIKVSNNISCLVYTAPTFLYVDGIPLHITIMKAFPPLVLLFCVILASGLSVRTEARDGQSMTDSRWPDTSDRTVTMSFEEHDDYKNLTHAYDHLWDDLLPANGGFLSKTYSNGKSHGQGISMFHQLYCLQIMRSAYQSMQEKLNGMHHERRELQEEKSHKHMHLGQDHWLHGFDYLRQTCKIV